MMDASTQTGGSSLAPRGPLVCTVLPTYNERDNIAELIDGVLRNACTPHMVLVVDDDSPDGTWQVVQELEARYNADGERRLVLYRRQGEKGLTSAIQRGVDVAIYSFGAEVVTWMDCDLSMPPAEVAQLVGLIVNGGADVAAGSRWVKGGSDYAHSLMAVVLSRIINWLAMWAISPRVHDYTSGFIAARAEVLRGLRLRGDYGEYCIDLLGRALQAGYDVREAPYRCVPRSSGASKTGVNLWDYLVKGRKYVKTIFTTALE